MAVKQDTKPVWEECGMTQSQFMSFIRSGLRQVWQKYKLRYQVLADAKVPNNNLFPSTAKQVYKCANCGRYFPANMTRNKKKHNLICVDHVEPAGALKSFEDLPDFVQKLFPKKSGLQVLCNYKKEMFEEFGQPSCHYTKTQEEREAKKKEKAK